MRKLKSLAAPVRTLMSAACACALLAGCNKVGADAHAIRTTDARNAIGQRVNAEAEAACPFPDNMAQYEQTTLAARTATTPLPRLGVFDTAPKGCAIVVFTLNDAGLLRTARVVSANPPAFGTIAPKIMRWTNLATGESNATEFMVRLGAEKLPDGGAMISLAFKDSTVDLEIPP
jgi:hypothetical protein